MTPRERLLAVLRKGAPDRIPWSPLIDGYYLAGLKKEQTDMEAALEIGADVLIRKVPVFSRSVFRAHELPGKTGADTPLIPPSGGISEKTEVKGGSLYRTYRTPVGTLTELWETNEASPYIPFPVEYLIKKQEDIKVYMYLIEHEEFVPYFDAFNKIDSKLGDGGLVTTTVPHTPVQHLLLIHMGVEKFYYMLFDHRDEMNALMDLMHERNKEVCEIINKSPAELCIEYENTGTTYVSPQIYEDLEMPGIDEYADILHEGDKIFLVHMCGRLKGLAEMIGRGRQDGSIDIATVPTGDWTLADAKNAWPEKIIGGGIDSITLAKGTPDEVAEHVKEVLHSIAPGDGIILGSSDAVPLGTPPENLMAVTKTVEAYGGYPSSV